MKRLLGLAMVAAMVGVQSCAGQTATPEAAVKQFKAAVDKGQATAVLDLLPPSYVKDMTGLLQDFAGRMDPEIWTKLRETLGKVTGALGAKAGLLVEMNAEGKTLSPDAKAAQTKALTEAISAVGLLAKNDITSLETMKKTDAPTFAKEVGTLFAAAMTATRALEGDVPGLGKDDMKVLKSEKLPNGNFALTFAGKDGAADETEEFKQVEGRWVPAEMADEWTKSMTEARDGLKKIEFTSPEGQANKAQTLMMLGMLDPMIQQFSTAQTVEQLQGMMGSMLMPLMMMGGGGMGGPGGAPAGGSMAMPPMAPPAP